MTTDELAETYGTDVAEEFDEEEDEDSVESDLSQALELLEACLMQIDARLTCKKGKRKPLWASDKELKGLALEVTAYLDQFQNVEEEEND